MGYHGTMSEQLLNDFIEYTILGDECRPEVVDRVEQAASGDPSAQARLANLKGMFSKLSGANLKLALMECGNQLVTHHGFNPAASGDDPPSTQPIKDFTDWLNETPDAQSILATMGMNWE